MLELGCGLRRVHGLLRRVLVNQHGREGLLGVRRVGEVKWVLRNGGRRVRFRVEELEGGLDCPRRARG